MPSRNAGTVDLPMTSTRRTRRRGATFRILRGIALVVLAFVLLPYLIVPLYRFVEPVSTVMLWRRLTGAPVERRVVPIAQMGPLPRTVIVAEDAAFCSHRGIDWRGIYRAFEEATEVSEMRGASTITQQVAKNLFLWQGRSYVRKALELPLALWIDLVLPKWRILEIYLNVAQWGPTGQFGAEAASRYAFGKPALQVTTREAALLAATLPNPVRRSARNPGPVVSRIARLHEARALRAPGLSACVRP
jgi:monofunctional biosynthetic peptidoglycan transglycosylase